MKQIIYVLASVSLLAVSACNKGASPRTSLSNDDEKVIYSIGMDMGSKLKTLQLSEKEMTVLKMGIDDGAKDGAKPLVEQKDFLPKIGDLIRKRQESFAKKEEENSKSFLDKAAASEKAEKTESGLIYVATQEGTGESPKETDRVEVNYHGTLRSGEVFDSTRDRGQPASFRLDRVIPCWKEGVQKMKVGGKSELYCPSAIAYGERGAPPKIPPGAALKFEVELLKILKDEEAAPKKK